MSTIGSRAKFKTRDGKTVSMLVTEERSYLPVFDYEIVDGDGEVVEHGEIFGGYYAMLDRAQRRGWTPVD